MRFVDVALFLLGVYLSMRVIAALYGVIDLWYTIRTAYPRVIRGIVGWGGAIVVVVALAGEGGRASVLWGLAAFLVFYLGSYVLLRLVVREPGA